MSGHLDPAMITTVIDTYEDMLHVASRVAGRTTAEHRAWARAAAVWVLTDPDYPVRLVPA